MEKDRLNTLAVILSRIDVGYYSDINTKKTAPHKFKLIKTK